MANGANRHSPSIADPVQPGLTFRFGSGGGVCACNQPQRIECEVEVERRAEPFCPSDMSRMPQRLHRGCITTTHNTKSMRYHIPTAKGGREGRNGVSYFRTGTWKISIEVSCGAA
jgi:hypothetical protein